MRADLLVAVIYLNKIVYPEHKKLFQVSTLPLFFSIPTKSYKSHL